MDPCSNSNQRRGSGQVGSNADRGGASRKATSQHASPGGGDVASLFAGHSRSASERGLYSIHLFRPYAAAL